MLKYFCLCCTILLLLCACRRPFEPEVAAVQPNPLLIVGGIINTSNHGITTITLSRTRPVTDTLSPDPETGARVIIESNTGQSYLLQESRAGIYTSEPLQLNPNVPYVIQIQRSNGTLYRSAEVIPRQTPAIDSVTWQQDATGIQVYVHTADPTNATRYYQWFCTETSNYFAVLPSVYGVRNNQIFVKAPGEQTDTCWTTFRRGDILLGNSVALGSDVLLYEKLFRIPASDKRITDRYSVLVQQYALQPEAYRYWDVIRQNAAALGTLFDRQPSQLRGSNIRCLTNPNEIVIGFMSAASLSEKRIFIQRNQLQNWNVGRDFSFSCGEQVIPQDPVDFTRFNYPDTAYGPWYFASGGLLFIARKQCLDCTYQGGTNIRPTFW